MGFIGEIQTYEKLFFLGKDDDGSEIFCRVVFTFSYPSGKYYIVYEVGEDEDGTVELQANLYRPDSLVINDDTNEAILEVSPIEDEQDWDIVREAFECWMKSD